MSRIQQNDTFFNDISATCMLLLPNTDGFSIQSALLLINFVVGLPANVWMVWLICGGTTELLASKIYSLNLAVSEILYCLGLPAQLYCMYNVHNTMRIFQQSYDGIDILLAVQMSLVWIGRPIFQSCICVEHYIAVVHPLIFIRLKPLKYKVAQCALSWCVILSIILPHFTLPEEVLRISGLIWFVPTVCIFLFCYFSVLCSLKRPGPGGRQQGTTSGNKIKIKAFNIILVHLVCFLVNYLPTLIIQSLPSHIYKPIIILHVSINLGVVCGLVHPLLYLHRAGKLSCLKKALTSRADGQK